MAGVARKIKRGKWERLCRRYLRWMEKTYGDLGKDVILDISFEFFRDMDDRPWWIAWTDMYPKTLGPGEHISGSQAKARWIALKDMAMDLQRWDFAGDMASSYLKRIDSYEELDLWISSRGF